MDDTELDRRLKNLDPASLDPAAAQAIVTRSTRAPVRRRPWRLATTLGVLLVGGVALPAATDIDEYIMSRPPFVSLDAGEFRTTAGLRYQPLGDHDTGEHCLLFVDFANVDAPQFQELDAHWSGVDPDAFAAGVASRLSASPSAIDESEAQTSQLLEELQQVVPELRWGDGPGPSIASFAVTCTPGLW